MRISVAIIVFIQIVFFANIGRSSDLNPTIDIGNESYSCKETHRIKYDTLQFGPSVSKYLFCKSSSGQAGFYNPEASKMVVLGSKGLELKALKKNNFPEVLTENEQMIRTLASYLKDSEPTDLKMKVVDQDEFQEASQMALTQLIKIRETALSEEKLPHSITLEGIDAKKKLTCERGQNKELHNSDEWQNIGLRGCALYYCESGGRSFVASFGGAEYTVPVQSLDGELLGTTYQATKVTDGSGKILAEPKGLGEAYTPAMVATYGNVTMNKFLRKYSSEPCDSHQINTFYRTYEKAIKDKSTEIANMDVTLSLQDSLGVMEKIIKPSQSCVPSDSKKYNSPPKILIPSDKNSMTMTEAKKLFDSYKNRSDLPHYTPSGCEARAHVMASDLDSKGYFAEKIFIQAENLTPDSSPSVRWSGHVAPVVGVQKSDGSIERMVFDTLLFDHPVSVETWLNHIKRPDGQTLLWASYPPPKNLIEYHRAAVTLAPWTVYWPDEKMAKTAQEKQVFLKRALEVNKANQTQLKKIQQAYLNSEF